MSVDECEQVRIFSAAQGNESPAGDEAKSLTDFYQECIARRPDSSVAERIHGKDDVGSSILPLGSGVCNF